MNLMLQLIQWAVDMKLMIQWAVTSSALILIVLAVRYLFRKKLSARLKYALWGVVLLRLLAPFQIELPAAAPVPVLASNLAQDVTPWLDDTMLYAVPTEDQPSNSMPEGLPPQYQRNGFPDYGWEYYTGGVVYDGGHITRYAVMLSALEVVVLIWIAGTALTALVILTSNLRFARWLRKRRERLEGVDAPIPVYTAEGLASPCLFGVIRPAVYVTPGAAEDPRALRHILAHELTHYAHKDHIWSLLRCFSLALHWYNPLVWLAVGLSKRDGELACDEGAIARLGEGERIPYGRTLVDMVAARSLRPADLLSCSTAMTGGRKSIQQRVAALVKKPETVRTALFAVIALVALGLVFAFAGRKSTAALDEYRSAVDRLERVELVHYGVPNYVIEDPELLEQAKALLQDIDPAGAGETADAEYGSSGITLFCGGPEGQEVLFEYSYQVQAGHGEGVRLVRFSEQDNFTGEVVGCLPGDAYDRLAELNGQQEGSGERIHLGTATLHVSEPVLMTQAELSRHTPEGIWEAIGYRLRGWGGDLKDAKFDFGYISLTRMQLYYTGDETHGGCWILELLAPMISSHSSGYTVLADQPVRVYAAEQNKGTSPGYDGMDIEGFAAFLRPEDVESVTAGDYEPGHAIGLEALDLPALKEQLTQSLYHQFSAEYDEEKYGKYVINVEVKHGDEKTYDGRALPDEAWRLTISVGEEKDAVCLRHKIFVANNDPLYIFVRSPELYRTIRNIFD